MDIPLSMSVKLSSPVTLEVYSSFANASTATGKKVNSSGFTLAAGKTVPLYIVAPSSNDKHAKNAVIGQYLQGTMTLAKDECGKKADVYPVKYILNEPAKREKSAGKKGSGKSGEAPSLEDNMFDAKVNWLAKMDPDANESSVLYKQLVEEKNDSLKGKDQKEDIPEGKEKRKIETAILQVHAARLASMEIDKKLELENINPKRAEEALKVCDAMLGNSPILNFVFKYIIL